MNEKYEATALKEVLTFWFEELTEEDWFAGGKELDETIKSRFAELHTRVAAGDFAGDRKGVYDYLAEVIVLDQFSRQIYRGEAKAFAFDELALSLAQEAIAKGYDTQLVGDEKLFLYLPFMHSESKVVHEEAVKLFEALGDEGSLKYEMIHKDIIDRFGRYPHRNKQLGRESTAEEIEYLSNSSETFFAS